MNYRESIEYIHSISWTFCKPGLERISALCEKLGDPQNDLKFVHVAGTNGKGSFCSMLSSVLVSAGYKVGLYTSPYIRFFNERMCINGTPISDAELAEITSYVRPIADKMTDKPTEFELITAIALEYFKRNRCDIVVFEAGMGGRLDSTNVINTPLLSVITGIALDHVAFLGDTTEKIAAEKAGIIKHGIPVLFGGNDADAERVIKNKASEMGAEYFRADYGKLIIKRADLEGGVFDFSSHKDMSIKLLGMYQPRNASLVITAVDILRERGIDIPEGAVKDGLSKASWSGRFEKIMSDPLMIFDGAHNPEGIVSAVESVKKYFGDEKVYLLTGVLSDKDYSFIAKKLAEIGARAFTITPNSPRALSAEEFARILEGEGVEAKAFTTLEEAFETAHDAAKRDRVPLMCLGSLYTYADLMPIVEKKIKSAKTLDK